MLLATTCTSTSGRDDAPDSAAPQHRPHCWRLGRRNRDTEFRGTPRMTKWTDSPNQNACLMPVCASLASALWVAVTPWWVPSEHSSNVAVR
jgi:hypothetical protein